MSKQPETSAGNTVPTGVAHALRGTAFVAMALAASACSKAPPAPPGPVASAPTATPTATATASGADSSVPNAGSVLSPGAATKVDPVAGRTNATMTRAEESSAMPMPGQNNDHSAPLGPAKRASSP